jgi:DNA-binding MarR family transcriptional regulator
MVNSALAAIMGQVCSLKPEMALLIELYEAEGEGKRLSASSLGLISGIPSTTTIRYVRYLEQQGWITRVPHEFDQRVVYIRLQPALVAQLDKVFRG